jgi:hypothetical protein
MHAQLRSFVCALFLLTLVGCASTDFVRPDADTLRNGQTTRAQVVQRLGAPHRESSLVRNEQTFKAIVYVYFSMAGKPLHPGVIPTRTLNLIFDNDVLVGHLFSSSWADEHTDFDEGKRKEIIKGTTTRSDALRIMGTPNGYFSPPLITAPAQEMVLYSYVEWRGQTGNARSYKKELFISFDSAGVVLEVEFSSTGQKE